MEQTLIKVKLPKRLIKALGLKQGERLESVLEEGNGVFVLSGESAIEPAFSNADIEGDGVNHRLELLSQRRKPPVVGCSWICRKGSFEEGILSASQALNWRCHMHDAP